MSDWPQLGIDPRFVGLGLALGLGLLIGLEREWEDKPIGLRSFGLIGLFGGLAAMFLEAAGVWLVVAGLVALGAVVLVIGKASKVSGITTLVAGLIVYLVGAAAVAGFWPHATVVAGVVTLILHWKEPMHRQVERIGRDDLETIARFVLITLVILPVLPNQSFGPYGVINPFGTWLLVVLIVGINLVGYMLFRLASTGTGLWLAGAVGGLVSSTATTFSYSAMSRRNARLGPLAALIILIASLVVYLRVLLEVFVVAPGLITAIAGPCLALALVIAIASGVVYFASKGRLHADIPQQANPARIRSALTFGAVYLVVLFAVAAAKELAGDNAVYGVALISGLTDVDALTLSMGQLYSSGGTDADMAWRAIFLGTLGNLIFKLGVACITGSSSLRNWMLASAIPALIAGFAILAFWPA